MDTDDLRNEVLSCGRRARVAARALAQMSTERKNAGLLAMADQLCASANTICQANGKDVEKATTDQLSLPIIDRLKLDESRIRAMGEGVRQVAALEDPVGKVIAEWTRPNGLHISKVRVPIGVIGIIYESRPNVTSDAAVLCTKTGNAVILRGGSESIRSNTAIAEALRAGAARVGLPEDSILLIPSTGRDAVRHMAEKKVEIRADPESFRHLSALSYQPLHSVRDEDWTTEYLDLILAARTVDNIEDAIAHVDKCGSHHSDVIITRDAARAEKFLNEVDSATVYWNASTRFTDGREFGFGAEIGISTDKLHARGPMALEELTTYKYIIRGEGQIRE